MDKKTMVYIGPTIKNVLQSGTAFLGGYPPKVNEVFKQDPFLTDLIIPVDKLAEVRKEIKDPRSGRSMLYRRAERRGE